MRLRYKCVFLLAGLSPSATFATGVVVEMLAPGSALERAGARKGDLFLSWERREADSREEEAAGRIDSFFDWEWMRVEQAPRGPVILHGRRDGRAFELTLLPGAARSRIRPWLNDADLEAYLRGRRRVDAGEVGEAVSTWRAMSRREEGEERTWRFRCWLAMLVGEAWTTEQRWEEVVAAYDRAAAAALDPVVRAFALDAGGMALLQGQARADDAERAFRAALAARRAAGPSTLSVARSLTRVGAVLHLRGALEEAMEHFHDALEIRLRLAPRSLETAGSLGNLAVGADDQGDIARSLDFYERSARVLAELGDDGALSRHLHNLGTTYGNIGEIELAEKHLRAALEANLRLDPESTKSVRSQAVLGQFLLRWGELDLAEDLVRRAIEVGERSAPGSRPLALAWTALGAIARQRGDLEGARRHNLRALDTFREFDAGGVDAARVLHRLGAVSVEAGDLVAARDYYERALEVFTRAAPRGLHTGVTLTHLGEVALEADDLDLARRTLQRAEAVIRTSAPWSHNHADALRALGRVQARAGALDKAVESMTEAVAIIDAQSGRLGGHRDAEGRYRAQFAPHYFDLIDLLVVQGRAAEALHVAERSRARGFLAMLAERDLDFAADVPAELDRRRRINAQLYDRVQAQRREIDPDREAELLRELEVELRRLRTEREGIAAEVRRASPRLAALQYPQPLGLDRIRATLDPGTALLTYSIGPEHSLLFVLSPTGDLRVERLAVAEAELRAHVTNFLGLIEEARSDSEFGRLQLAALRRLGGHLYELLVAPAADALAASERLLVVPDGPLHLLPWGALVRTEEEADPTADGRYLIERWPIHQALSATVYAEILARRSEPGKTPGPDEPDLVAFGDPEYPTRYPSRAEGTGDLRVRGAVERGLDLTPLPHSRREVDGIATLFAAGRVETYFDERATEERAKAVPRGTALLHFAVHGYSDARFPLNSALALAIPEDSGGARDNGLLQAWEIFEQVRVDADLVVLSACATALGEEVRNEGLIGLTRAFQYAGARTVAGTLWNVADDATAELMARFYRRLREGWAADEALRSAQLDLLRRPITLPASGGVRLEKDASSPYYWASFQLYGDWRQVRRTQGQSQDRTAGR